MKFKILFIDHDNEFTGSTASLLYIIKEFKKKEWDITVLTNKNKIDSDCFNKYQIKIINSKTFLALGLHFASPTNLLTLKGIYSTFLIFIRSILGFNETLKVINNTKPNIIYINEYVTLQCGLAGRYLKIPVVYHIRSQMMRGHFGFRRRIIQMLICKSASKIIAISKKEAEQFNSVKCCTKLEVIPEFIDGEECLIEKIDRNILPALDLEANSQIIITLGGFDPIKGTIDIIKALVHLSENGKNIHLIICGKIDFKDYNSIKYSNSCKQIISTSVIKDRVHILGYIQNPNYLISISDVLISSNSRPHFSRPVIEAWFKKKPVIVSDSPHTQEYITNLIDGLIYTSGDHLQLAQKIKQILNDEKLKMKLSENGFNKAVSIYNSKINCGEIVSVCNKLVKKKMNFE